MKEKRPGAAMIIAGVVMMLFLGNIYAWSVFRVQIGAAFPTFTSAQLSLNFTITMVTFVLGGFLGGQLSARRSQRDSLRVSAALMLLGLLGVSFMEGLEPGPALALMYVCYGGLSGLGVGFGYNACVSGIAPWFPGHLGLVTGVQLMGVGFGSLLLGLLAQRLSASMGIFGVFRVYAVAEAVVLTAGSFFIRKPPLPEKSARTGGVRSLEPRQMLRRGSFWLYFVWNTLLASAGMLVINSAANIAVFFGVSAVLGLVTSVFNGAGRPVVGVIMDRLGQFGGMLVMNSMLVLAGALLLAAAFTGSVAAMFGGMIFSGICYGGGITVSAKVINDTYGPEHYAVNLSLANFCTIPAAFLGPLVSGLLEDRSGGDYTGTFLMMTGLAVLDLIIMGLLKLRLRREQL